MIEPHRRYSTHRQSSKRADIARAFSDGWRDGHSVTITLCREGIVRVRKNGKEVAYFEDMTTFAEEFLPEILE